MSRRRKTRIKAKELRLQHEEDPFEDFEGSLTELYLEKTLHWIRRNLRQILIASGVAVTALIVGVVILAWQQNIEKSSMLAFEKLLEKHGGGGGLSSASLALEDIENYEKKFSTTDSHIRAALLKTKFLIENEEYEKAAKGCLFLAKNMESAELKAYFYLRGALLMERAKKTPEALRAYQEVAKAETPSKTVRLHARYGELRMLLSARRKADAKAVLERILKLDIERPDLRKIQKQALALMLSAE